MKSFHSALQLIVCIAALGAGHIDSAIIAFVIFLQTEIIKTNKE